MTKKERRLSEILANRQHINDLQFRLDIVASNAKPRGQKVRIGSTMPYAVVAKREAKKQAKLRERQFGSFRSTVTGKSLTYLKDGEYLPR
jgi:hypothetical protein